MAQQQNKLVLNINNSRPITAADMGRVFASMALDYQKATGQKLVIARLEHGSVIAVLQEAASHFQDAAALADSVNHLIDFAKNIAGIAAVALGAAIIKTKIFGSGGENGSRTVESIAKMAIAAGATVELYSPESPKSVLRITPSDGRRIRRFATKNKKLKKPHSQKDEAHELGVEMRAAIAEAVLRGDEPSKRLIAVFAEMLKKRSLGHLLLEMADELQKKGDFDAAQLLRAAYDGRSRGQAPFIEV
jgi:hypothetical protein